MKNMKKVLAVVLSMAMVMAMSVAAFAADLGTGTITVENATKGQTYTAYKIFNATYSGNAVSYKVDEAHKASVSTEFFDVGTVAETIDGASYYSVSKKSTATDAQIIAWASANYQYFDSNGKTGTYNEDGTVKFTDMPYGYYYITSSLGAVVTIDTANPNATVKDKNTGAPNNPDKKITAEDATAISEAEENAAGVGSTETFKVTYNGTNWATTTTTDAETGAVTATAVQVKDFQIVDTPTGLDIDASTVKITVNGTTIYENGASVNTTNVTTVSKGTDGALTIVIPWVDNKNASLYETTSGNANIPVVVTYDATITADAATAVAPNSVEITYNHDSSTDKGYVTPENTPEITNTYTYKFQLDKTDDSYKALTGAKFELYKGSVADANKVSFTVSGTTYTAVKSGTTGAVTEIDMSSDANVLIQGLDQADYFLRETVAPTGYNKADDTAVPASTLVRVDGTITDNDGVESDSGVATVVNKAGQELPETGGIGTTIFYVIGSVLVIGAGVVMITRRRMNF